MSVEFLPGGSGAVGEPVAPPPSPPPAQPPPPRRPRRLRWDRLAPRSLSARLLVGVVTLVVALVVAIGGTTYYFLNSFLHERLDQQVKASAQQNVAFLRGCVLEVLQRPQTQQCNNGFPSTEREFLTVLVPADLDIPGISVKFGNVSKLDLTTAQEQDFVQRPGKIVVLHQGGEELHVASAQSSLIGGYQLTVVTGLSTDNADTVLRRLVLLEVLVGGAAVLLALGLTSWGVQRGLRNLYRVTGTAQEVADELSPEGAGLERRVPVVEPGTEVGQLAASVNTLLSAVETQFAARLESEQRMRRFLADASHELRTPLTSIRGFAELARMQKAAGDPGEAEDNLHRIESEGTRMSRLVEDLLLLARGDAAENAHPIEREPVDVAELLDDVASATRAAFPERRVDVQALPVPIVAGDHDQLLRVVRNLATNACVHTRADRPVLLRCYPDDGGVAIQVVDGGPGLPPDEAEHVFERFWRADKARTRARGGSGLGLSIVATVVRAHGGSVRFDSAVETGSTVTVWLPVAPPAAPDPHPAGAAG